MYVYKNKSTTTFDVFVSVGQVAKNLDNILPVYNLCKVEHYLYIKDTFTLYYTGAVTNATKLRQGISSDNSTRKKCSKAAEVTNIANFTYYHSPNFGATLLVTTRTKQGNCYYSNI